MVGKRICIVTLGSSEKPVDEYLDLDILEYDIFILDLDFKSDRFEESRVRISRGCIYNGAFCILGSTLYAFASYHDIYNPDPQQWRTILKYELPTSSTSFNLKLNRSDFVEGGLLNDGKLHPTATVLEDGRILVFSTEIETTRYRPPRCDFEIFDPVNGVCHQLPKLRPTSVENPVSFYISSHTLIENNLVIQTEEEGSYTLNLDPPHNTKLWEVSSFPWASFLPSHPGRYFEVIDEAICLIPYHAYDVSDLKKREDPFSRWFYEFPDLSSVPKVGYRYVHGGGLTILEDGFDTQSQISLCFLKVGLNCDTNQPHMFLDAYKLDLQKCRRELDSIRAKRMEDGENEELLMEDGENEEPIPLPGATKIKSYDFMLQAKARFYVENFSFIRAA